MTDAERDNIDQDAEKYMRLCSNVIAKLKKDCKLAGMHPFNKDIIIHCLLLKKMRNSYQNNLYSHNGCKLRRL